MGVVRQIHIKNRTYYFYNDMTNIKKFDSNLLKIDNKSYKDIGIYNIGYIKIKKIDDYENIYHANPLHLIIAHESGYIECNSTEVIWFLILQMKINNYLKKYNDVFNRIKNKIKKMSSDGCDYEKDYMKIKFNSDDDLPLNKALQFHNITITIKSVFEEDGKLCPQVFLDDTLYELNI